MLDQPDIARFKALADNGLPVDCALALTQQYYGYIVMDAVEDGLDDDGFTCLSSDCRIIHRFAFGLHCSA
jgi:hypothetical protein